MAKSTRRPRDEDDEEPPRRRRRDEDDRDEPPRSRRRDVDDSDEPPRRKRDEEPPRRRRDEIDDEPPRKRRRAEISPGTPTVYIHEECKGRTEMPEKFIREYLENPFELGEEPTTVCTRCDEEVGWRDCYWADTRQNMYEYLEDRRAELIIADKDPRPDSPPLNWLIPVIGAVLGGSLAGGFGAKIGHRLVVGAAGAALGAMLGVIYMFIDRSRNATATEEWNRKLVKRYYKRHPEAQSKRRSRRDDD